MSTWDFLGRLSTSFADSLSEGERTLATGERVTLPLDDITTLVALNIFYFVMTGILTVFMKRREQRFELKGYMLFYNLSCVLLALGVVLGFAYLIAIGYINRMYGNENLLDARTNKGSFMNWVIWLYYAQKFWEYQDTFIFVLRKSWRQVTFLHLYHHSSITFITWALFIYDRSGDAYMPSMWNSFVHVLMYSHYFLSALKFNTWWKPYLTSLQLIQFFTLLFQVIFAWLAGPSVGYPDWLKFAMFLYLLSMLYLFGSFFVKSYAKKPAQGKKSE